MANLTRVRGASLAASALTTGAALIAALTVSYSVRLTMLGDNSRPVVIAEVASPPRPPERARPPTPLRREAENPASLAPPVPQPDLPPPPMQIEYAPPAEPSPISGPHWLQRPQELDRYYPKRAREAAIEGLVVLDCRVSTLGALRCAIVSETPQGWDFADAALRMSEAYRMAPAFRGGEPVEGRYRMRIPFTLR